MLLTHYPKYFILGLIRVYQHILSPDHGIFKVLFPGGYCKFNPSCSEYMYQSIEHFGVMHGGIKGMYRLLRCNPCSKGGIDHVK